MPWFKVGFETGGRSGEEEVMEFENEEQALAWAWAQAIYDIHTWAEEVEGEDA